jgi:starvation-inducible outer membrane lipoprotein
MTRKGLLSVLVVILVLSMFLVLTGCSAIFKGIGGKIGDEISEQIDKVTDELNETTKDTTEDENETTATTTKPAATTAETTTTVTDSGIEWPQDKMGDLSRIDAPIQGVMKGEYGTIVTFAGVTKEVAKEYIKVLKDLDYEAMVEQEDSEIITFYGSKEVDDKKLNILCTYDVKEQTCMLTYTEE